MFQIKNVHHNSLQQINEWTVKAVRSTVLGVWVAYALEWLFATNLLSTISVTVHFCQQKQNYLFHFQTFVWLFSLLPPHNNAKFSLFFVFLGTKHSVPNCKVSTNYIWKRDTNRGIKIEYRVVLFQPRNKSHVAECGLVSWVLIFQIRQF